MGAIFRYKLAPLKWGRFDFEPRFLEAEAKLAKTLETSMRHQAEKLKSGRIWDNSENSSRYLNLSPKGQGGGAPLAPFVTTSTEPFNKKRLDFDYF